MILIYVVVHHRLVGNVILHKRYNRSHVRFSAFQMFIFFSVAVCNFVVHDRCLKAVVSPCSSIAANLIKVRYILRLVRLTVITGVTYATLDLTRVYIRLKIVSTFDLEYSKDVIRDFMCINFNVFFFLLQDFFLDIYKVFKTSLRRLGNFLCLNFSHCTVWKYIILIIKLRSMTVELTAYVYGNLSRQRLIISHKQNIFL